MGSCCKHIRVCKGGVRTAPAEGAEDEAEEDEKKGVGGRVGLFFLVQDCSVLLLHNNRCCYFPSPFVDEYGPCPFPLVSYHFPSVPPIILFFCPLVTLLTFSSRPHLSAFLASPPPPPSPLIPLNPTAPCYSRRSEPRRLPRQAPSPLPLTLREAKGALGGGRCGKGGGKEEVGGWKARHHGLLLREERINARHK